MSEVNGFLIFRLPDIVLNRIESGDGRLGSSMIAEIIEFAGINEPIEEKLVLHDLDLMCNGLEKKSDLLLVYPFDEHFMDFAKLLAEHGEGVEVYGAIGHEAGVSGYYLLDADGNRSVTFIDIESEEDVDPAETFAQLLKQIPEHIKQTFDDVFT